MTIASNEYPVLNKLIERLGGVQLEYVGDIWGSEHRLITPEEVLDLHKSLDWDEQGYEVLSFGDPGDPVLQVNGQTVLQIPGEPR
jgi:hypothetical protein